MYGQKIITKVISSLDKRFDFMIKKIFLYHRSTSAVPYKVYNKQRWLQISLTLKSILASSIVYEQVTKRIPPNYITSPIDKLTGKNNHARNIVSVKSITIIVYKIPSGKYGKDFTKNYLKMSKSIFC